MKDLQKWHVVINSVYQNSDLLKTGDLFLFAFCLEKLLVDDLMGEGEEVK